MFAAVFGSAARNDMRPDSDIDLFLVRPSDANERTWHSAVESLERLSTRWTGNDTRALVMDVDEVEHGAGAELVLADIARDGIPVHGTSSWLRTRLRARG